MFRMAHRQRQCKIHVLSLSLCYMNMPTHPSKDSWEYLKSIWMHVQCNNTFKLMCADGCEMSGISYTHVWQVHMYVFFMFASVCL